MAGHSKWANIKHRKAAADAKKGKAFSKIAKEITVAARLGGGDPSANISLRPLLAKARGVNMPVDNIERAIKKGTGELNDGVVIEEMSYEGYADGGVGIIVKVLTDNKNRSASEVRHCFTKNNNSLGQVGSVSRTFQRKGLISVLSEGVEEEALLEAALEAGAENFEEDGDTFSITTDPNDFNTVCEALTDAGFTLDSAEITLIPDVYMDVTDVDQARRILRFVEALEDLDDVQDVYHNLDVSDEIMAQLDADE